ncbi:MYG1 exonuclease-like [Gigantopelta aegis]|uniref:MYG1 exonuclease-like n=1 Tax=Gigantopelta aegis TaxID=1735272 RepID=UPI001B88C393|nr:MYG1 exonuclease-like [Gigantopelta aegis]
MSGEPVCKKPCMMNIGTHNGQFHCDEVLACYMLKSLPEYQDAEIVRTRDEKELEKCDVVVDVGAVFDPSKNRFDHHQRTFSETMNSLMPKKKWTTKLSSAGLVYVHFGHQVVGKLLGLKPADHITDVIYDKVYENLVEEIDAIDNGIHQTDGIPRYHISTDLSSRVGHLNPNWNESDTDVDKCFHQAIKMVGDEFEDRVKYYKSAWLPARDIVQKAIENRKEVDPSGEIACMSSNGVPWRDHLFSLEEELGINLPIKYMLYTDQSGAWRIQCVPVRVGSFESRLSLLEEWRGFRDEELSKKSGIPGCIFVHSSGFIGGNKTYESVLEMARKCLQQQAKNGSS